MTTKKLVLIALAIAPLFGVGGAYAATDPQVTSKHYVDSGLVQKQNKLGGDTYDGQVVLATGTAGTVDYRGIDTTISGTGSSNLVTSAAVAAKIADLTSGSITKADLSATNGIDYNSTTGEFSLSTATQNSLGLADTALQSADIASTITGTDNTMVAGEKAVKDYVDGAIVASAYNDTALAGRVTTIENAGYQNATQVTNAITTEIGNLGLGELATSAITEASVQDLIDNVPGYITSDNIAGKADAVATGAGTGTKVTVNAQGIVTSTTDAGIADITGLQTALDAKVTNPNCAENQVLMAGAGGVMTCIDVVDTTYSE